jgi:hypothetical protein
VVLENYIEKVVGRIDDNGALGFATLILHQPPAPLRIYLLPICETKDNAIVFACSREIGASGLTRLGGGR